MSKPQYAKLAGIDFSAAAFAAAACGGFLSLFSDAFAKGATWSGLNPSGGGPGFLLLLTAGIISLLVFRRACPRRSVQFDIFWSAVFAFVSGGILWLYIIFLSNLPAEAAPPLVSGVVGSYFVPRVVVSVLQDTWARADGTAHAEAS